jgi:hypothetical protein
MIAAVSFVLAQVPRALLPILEHDESTYHLLLPKLYSDAHALVRLPWMVWANMPHLVDLSYVFPTAMGGFTSAKVFVLGFALWTFVGFVPLGRTMLGPIGPGLLAVLYLSGRPIQWHLGLTYVEPVIGALLLCAVLSLWRYHESELNATTHLIIMSIAIGAACASKYTAWPQAVIFFAIAALARPRSGRRITLRLLAVMAGICALLVVPWLVKSAVITGNPIYPIANQWFGAAYWSPIQNMQFQKGMGYGVGGYGEITQFLKLPYILVAERMDGGLGGGGFSASVMVLSLAAMMLPWRRDEFRTSLRILAIAGFVSWAVGPKIIRYFVAWSPVMVLTAGIALTPLRRLRWGLAVATIAAAIVGIAQMRLQPSPPSPLMATSSVEAFTVSRDELLSRNLCWSLTQLLNQVVPHGGRVLSFWENRLYFLDRPFVADSSYDDPTMLVRLRETGDTRAFARMLAAEGFTHIVVNRIWYQRYVTYQMADQDLFERFVSELDWLPVEGECRVMQLKTIGPK